MDNATLFLTLRVFSATGGIEKVSRVAGKALQEIAEENGSRVKILSMYDDTGDINQKYFPASIFKGFGKDKFRFLVAATREGIRSRQVILSHCNLLLAALFIKWYSPKTQVILMAHGIEVWDRFPPWKKYLLSKCDQVIAVSSYTRTRMMESHGINGSKITVLNNCVDPFLPKPQPAPKSDSLLARYQLSKRHLVLCTLTRLSSKEQYKGYDNVLFAVKSLVATNPDIRYLLIGKYDETEKKRVDGIVEKLSLQKHVIFTGFIPDEELGGHFNLADIYIMPSKKEGFGIAFIEAMFYGKPVIAGNKDGSTDALDGGRFGLLINPDDREAITEAIKRVIANQQHYVPDFSEVMQKFGYPAYKQALRELLHANVPATTVSISR